MESVQEQTLIKYNNPIPKTDQLIELESIKENIDNPNIGIAQILNNILPCKEVDEGTLQKIQTVSSTPATRLDVLNLHERLEKLLKDYKARTSGICPVREYLYDQCFDEIIRQVTINCQERGIQLKTVRDEVRTTIQSQQELQESIVSQGMRKSLKERQRKIEMQNQIIQLKGECEGLKNEIEQTNLRLQQEELEYQDKLKDMEQAHHTTISQLQDENVEIKKRIKVETDAKYKR